jgi:uncharacterized protein YoxC
MSDSNQTINPNTADLGELTLLPGVGKALAGRIIESRPFVSLEDMRRVPGLGPQSLERMQTMIVFSVSGAEDATDTSEVERVGLEKQDSEETSQVSVSKSPVIERSATAATRSQVLGISAAAAAVGVVVSLVLTLSILVGINRTLDFSRHSTVRELTGRVNRIEGQLEEIDLDLEDINRRLSVLEGLSGRMTELESETADLQADMQNALTQVQQMRTRVEGISLQIEELARQAQNQATFFERLQELLVETFGAPVEESAP